MSTQTNPIYRAFARFCAKILILFAQFLTAVRGIWAEEPKLDVPVVYFGNHVSNGDFVILWASLPPVIRKKTRPVAASDYWLVNKMRAFVGRDVVRAVLINRDPETREEDPIVLMQTALDEGSSLIIFPEGKRNMTEDPLLPFKTGIYHLAVARPETVFVPAWISNLNRVMPKGEVIPVPIVCTVHFGPSLRREPDESKDAFLSRAHAALLAQNPDKGA